MQVTTILLLMFFTYTSNCQDVNFAKMSKEVSKKHYKAGLKSKKPDEFHKIRLLLCKQHNLDFINKSDTLFFLESFHYETGEYFGRIWNTKEEISFMCYNNQFQTDNQKLFSSYMITIVENWDLRSIVIEEKQNSNLTPNNPITATRVITSSSKILIDCVKFKDFFKLERDRE